ncbi:MAG: PepSY domain-containing protein [Planctomycetota bacterium]|nr:MAG: PepSY domain-containing protein [Planctomycetota bacterium]
MRPRKTTYLVHRWIGLFIALQLLAWSIGGFVFSVLDIRAVRGEHNSTMIEARPLDAAAVPAHLREAVGAAGVCTTLELIDRGLGPHWEARDVDGVLLVRMGSDGSPAGPVTIEQAEAIAMDDFVHGSGVARSSVIEADPPVEYRGRPLPIYQIELDHASRTRIYVDAATGAITARRNRSWRLFDFFWMLHTMDYGGRDDFNHPLLTGASILAILASGSGLTLWGWRATSQIRRKTERKPSN